MITSLSVRVLAVSLISPLSFVLGLSSNDIPTDTPISSLLVSANQHLANGETNDALIYYDIAISRDPQNYLTYFKRGAAYLSVGKSSQARADFDQVLSIKPGFEGALVQRAKIRARSGDWEAAKKDYLEHGNSAKDLAQLEEAKGASILATVAEKSGNWEECITQSTKAISVANKMLSLRKIRAHCRLENGDLQEGLADLRHALQLQPGTIEPHLQISATLFFELADFERGIDQLRKCLHSDPDSTPCKRLYRRERSLEKEIVEVEKVLKKGQFVKTLKLLLPSSEQDGLVDQIKKDIKELREAGSIVGKSENLLIARVIDMTCEAYYKQSNLKKARSWCNEALEYNKVSLYGLLTQAKAQIQNEEYETAVRLLNDAAEHHPNSHEINELLQEAEIQLKRSKTKDYYKILEVPREADELQIKAAYRRLVKLHHPDKALKKGISKEDAEKKMAAINEAHEVLSNSELKKRYDLGDDPNNHEQQHQYPFQQGGWYTPGGFASSQFDGGTFKFEFNGHQFHF